MGFSFWNSVLNPEVILNVYLSLSEQNAMARAKKQYAKLHKGARKQRWEDDSEESRSEAGGSPTYSRQNIRFASQLTPPNTATRSKRVPRAIVQRTLSEPSLHLPHQHAPSVYTPSSHYGLFQLQSPQSETHSHYSNPHSPSLQKSYQSHPYPAALLQPLAIPGDDDMEINNTRWSDLPTPPADGTSPVFDQSEWSPHSISYSSFAPVTRPIPRHSNSMPLSPAYSYTPSQPSPTQQQHPQLEQYFPSPHHSYSPVLDNHPGMELSRFQLAEPSPISYRSQISYASDESCLSAGQTGMGVDYTQDVAFTPYHSSSQQMSNQYLPPGFAPGWDDRRGSEEQQQQQYSYGIGA